MSDIGAQIRDVFSGIRDLQNYVDAHVVIVGAQALDQTLERALQTKIQPLSRKLQKRIFDGPLSNFAAKIDMAYALGIVPKTIFDDLKLINRVRVRFAHTTKFKNFQDPEIAKLMKVISGMDATIPDTKLRFLKRVKEIVIHLDDIYDLHCKNTGQTPTDVDD